MSKGYILLARQLLHHPRFKPKGPFTQFEAWYWLIESAAYAPRQVPIMTGTRREIITLQPGQLSHSIRFLSAAWRWSPNRVRRFLRDLAMDGSVTTQTDTAQTLITLCNWDKYQRPFSEANTQADTQTDTQTDTKKKEIKERKNISPSGSGEPEGFAPWYAAYPKHVDRLEAAKAFTRLMRSGAITLEALMAATSRYAVKVANTEKRYIKAPSVWINKGSYLDEPDGGSEHAPAPIDPRTFTDAQWRKRLTDTTVWMKEWGPKPGEPGCFVPSNLILTPVSNSKGAA
jgi:hypothetical protein